jgi:peptide/nickel transport system permease protein
MTAETSSVSPGEESTVTLQARENRSRHLSPKWRRLWKNRSGLVAFAFLVTLALVVTIVPFLRLPAPDTMDTDAVASPPTAAHLLGTDGFGRDILSRLLFAGRVSLAVGILGAGTAAVVGTISGLLSGYRRGAIDAIFSRLADTILSFPVILLAIVLAGTLGPGLSNVVIALAVVFSPRFFRLTRGSTLALGSSEFVVAARILGGSDWRIMFRHILPNVLAPLVVQLTVSIAFAIIAEASLSFIGLGIQPPTPSWGTMLNEARAYMGSAPWFIVSVGSLLTLTGLSLNVLGDALRDAFDPTLQL